ncbi:MAG: NAD-dependent epimerase/dehydratase family protein [Thermoanaerobaculia bacterium]
MKHVVVTGGAGFIGSNVVDRYIERGYRVTVVDDLSTGRRENVHPKAELIVGDIGDPAVIQKLRDLDFQVLNHHAAQIDVRKSVDDPAADASTNIVATLRLLQLAAEKKIDKVIFASSGGAGYGEPETVPQTESHPFRPISPYGCAKVSIEFYLGYFRDVYGLESVALRYGNVYGPRQRPDGEAGVVAIFAGKLAKGEPVVINGDGEQTRDYVFVGDVARANIVATETPMSGGYNVGTGVETSVNALFDAICRAMGVQGKASHGPAKAGEQMRSVLDGSKIRREAGLGSFVALDEGLRMTV